MVAMMLNSLKAAGVDPELSTFFSHGLGTARQLRGTDS